MPFEGYGTPMIKVAVFEVLAKVKKRPSERGIFGGITLSMYREVRIETIDTKAKSPRYIIYLVWILPKTEITLFSKNQVLGDRNEESH